MPYTILHPNQLVTILKLFNLFITGLLERPVSGTLAHNMMLILELHHTNADKLRQLLADINISHPIGKCQIM